MFAKVNSFEFNGLTFCTCFGWKLRLRCLSLLQWFWIQEALDDNRGSMRSSISRNERNGSGVMKHSLVSQNTIRSTAKTVDSKAVKSREILCGLTWVSSAVPCMCFKRPVKNLPLCPVFASILGYATRFVFCLRTCFSAFNHVACPCKSCKTCFVTECILWVPSKANNMRHWSTWTLNSSLAGLVGKNHSMVIWVFPAQQRDAMCLPQIWTFMTFGILVGRHLCTLPW